MSTSLDLTCPLCSVASHLKFSLSDYIKHIKIFHAHNPSFKITCGINGCQRMFTNFGTFTNHMYDKHSAKSQCISNSDSTNSGFELEQPLPDEVQQISSDSDDDNEDEVAGCDLKVDTPIEPGSCSQELLQKSSATLLLGLQEKYKLTHASIQGIIQGVCSLNQLQLGVLKSEVNLCLCERNLLQIGFNL